MRTPEQIYKKYKAFCSGITKEEFINQLMKFKKKLLMKVLMQQLKLLLKFKKQLKLQVHI